MAESGEKDQNDQSELVKQIKRLEYDLSNARATNDNNDKATKALTEKIKDL
jgi:hypothetical protein